jgi:hypothetical protein
MKLEFTVATPRIKGRGEAWLAWEASLLKLYAGGKKRPSNIFWKHWKKLKLDFYKILSYKEFTGDVVLERLDGRTKTINLLEKPSRGGRQNVHAYDLIHGVKIKDEYPELQKAQAFIITLPGGWRWAGYENMMLLSKFPILFDCEYVEFRLNPAEVKMMLEIAEQDGTPPGMDVWTTNGPEHCGATWHGHYDYYGFYLDGVLGDSLQGLLNGLEHHGKLNPLGDTLDEKS